MNYIEIEEEKIILTLQDSFNISEILECGQCFRYEKINNNHYTIVAYGKMLNILQVEDKIQFFPTSKDEFENLWINYFDLSTNYSYIKNTLAKEDNVLKEAINFASGIRILNQEPWECLISFIISQNNRIPMIRKVIGNISEKYGENIYTGFAFPTIDSLKNANEEELKICKTGFRAKYIMDAVDKISNNFITNEEFYTLSTKELKEKLMCIKGVGPKVADCVLLFSCNRKEVFPTDVWIKRVMQHYYFEGKDVSIKEIHSFAENKWGELSGIAQQYLFNYAREQKIGKNVLLEK